MTWLKIILLLKFMLSEIYYRDLFVFLPFYTLYSEGFFVESFCCIRKTRFQFIHIVKLR